VTLNQDEKQKEIPITMNGTEVMNYLSLDPQKLCLLAKEGDLVPYAGQHPSWFKLLIGNLDELKRRFPDWLYLKSDVESFKLKNKEYLEGERKQKASKENIIDENRDKSNDIRQCRETAKKYVTDCNEKKEIPSIATAINIIRSLDFGRIYSVKQVRNWITRKPPIFPKESSKKGRRKNS
jgi:hypothetical protein